MGTSVAQESDLWKQIDDAECYLVSGSFDKAVLTALSVSDQIRADAAREVHDADELLEMLELAGMVLVQALKELRRTSEMFIQLKAMFGSVASVPVKIFLTGATMLMAEGSGPDLRPVFEEYLAQWRYTDDQVYVLNGGQERSSNGLIVTSTMATEEYFEVAELYTVTFLGIASNEPASAIAWVEKAELTDQDQQELLKKLHTLQAAAKKSSAATGAKQSAERNLSVSVNDKTPPTPEDGPTSTTRAPNGKTHGLPKSIEPTLQHVTNKFNPVFWWFHSVRVKVGKTHIVLPSGKLMLLFSLLFSALYVLRRKGAGLKRAIFQQASSLRRAFLDALQLAFSVQMNPLAAVQQTPQAPRGSW
ncbi:protein APEM9 [Lolium perenne]|uniref:protein APEM9 n=1 Tax=Lolium perenne TaxID=4522 RepID=UPI0021EA8A03|nr:protein APEM9 [Lolium perenne]XP_051199039.1 protein APEM9 [Lolium perenne]